MYHPEIVAKNRAKLEARLNLTLKEYSPTEVEDFAYRMRGVKCEGEAQNKLILEQPKDIQAYITNEMILSKVDFRYFCTRYCKILTAKKGLEPLIPWPSQELILQKLALAEKAQEKLDFCKIMMMILKSRQIGGTALCEALVAHLALLNPNTWGLIASDNMKVSSPKLWQVFVRMYQNLPWWMRPESDIEVRASNLHLKYLDSDVVMGAGNQKNTLGQGQTVDVAHLTEVSTWEAIDAVDEDLMPAFTSSEKHHSLMLLESTGKGARGNWFHDTYIAAMSKKNDFIPVFIAWYLRPSYKRSTEGITLTDETLLMAKRIQREQGFELSKEQLAWYQRGRESYASKGKLEVWLQEVPSVVEEAFQTGFRSVFPIELRSELRNNFREPLGVYEVDAENKKLAPLSVAIWRTLEGDERWMNKLIVWEWGRAGYSYVIGGDSSYGIEGKDNSAIQVLRVGNLKEMDEQVAEFCGNISPAVQANVYEMIGKIYADRVTGLPAMVAIEVNPGSPGIVPQNDLLLRNYPNFFTMTKPGRLGQAPTKEIGWHTTPGTRPLLTENGVKAIQDRELAINSPFLVQEMVTYVDTGIGKMKRHYEHAPGYHDDRIMAMFIAFYVAHESDVRILAEERRKHQERLKNPAVSDFPQGGFAFSTRMYDDLMEEWEERALSITESESLGFGL